MAITLGARRNGKTTAMLEATRQAVDAGEHVHVATRNGMRCIDGPADCTAERRTLAQLERDLRR